MEKKDIKILVIDDERGIRDMLSYELSDQGYTVITAVDGEDGLNKIKENNINLVITDVKMPKMDGIKMLEEIKKINPDIEVIMATGFGTIETAVDSMKKGAYDFIQKPFNLSEIQMLIEKALEKADLKAIIALYETSKAIFSSIKLEDLLPVIVKTSKKLLKADDVSIMLKDSEDKLYVAASEGLHSEDKKDARIKIGGVISGTISELKESSIIVGPVLKDQRFDAIVSAKEINSSIISLLMSKQGVAGVICAARTANLEPFNNNDKRYADIFSAQVSQTIENAKLYKQLEEKVFQLNQAYEKLSDIQKELVQAEKLAAIGELASGVAHELNNPLTVVIGLVQLMIEEGGLAQDKKTDLETIKEQAERCRKIILDLLQFSRKHESQRTLINITDTINKTLELVNYDLKSSGVKIITEFEKNIPAIKADFYQLQQVFLNIITNAYHAVKNVPNPQILIKLFNKDNILYLSFKDNGSGIDDNIIHKIFDPFFTTKDVKSGTGLGLSISYGIIKEHGGDIKVKSSLGKSTTFTVELPIDYEKT